MVRSFTWLGLACAILLPIQGRANHDSLPDPPSQQTSQKLPTLPHMDRAAVTVSGLSSGGFFAHQFHVAFSSLVKGAGILAGGPYGCVEAIPNPWLPFWRVPLDRGSAAVVACTHYYGDRYYGFRPSFPTAEASVRLIREAADQGLIDNPSNLADSRVWLFHGKSDTLVPLQVMETLDGCMIVSMSTSQTSSSTEIRPGLRPITAYRSADLRGRASSRSESAANMNRHL